MPRVTVYTSQSCPHCTTAKNYLLKEGIPFTEKDVTADPSAQRELASLGARGVPTFAIDDEVIVGFDRPRIEALLGARVIECPSCRKRLKVPANKGILKVTCPGCSHVFKVRT
ncbi:MAG: hypothetical protein AVO33_02205 [delta proteobacterium ML8_F1]|nr:MAG: hypothetical protein AVO33_02205 [delta proteobacterium ML8_F1]